MTEMKFSGFENHMPRAKLNINIFPKRSLNQNLDRKCSGYRWNNKFEDIKIEKAIVLFYFANSGFDTGEHPLRTYLAVNIISREGRK